ncbi:serine hydrolase [Nonomuraea sp. NPDC050404]|uniref:serine hydrolase n=1 Tax=Nonomuraea sp. NPDC050404 TaxID=3155783 RepID=UPI0033D476AD
MKTPSKPARLLSAAAVAITMTACVSQPGPVYATQTASAGSVAAPTIPDTLAGKQLTWLLDAVNRTPIPDDELAGHFSPDFLKAVPPAQVNEALASVKGMQVRRVLSSQNQYLLAEVTAGATTSNAEITVDTAGVIVGLQFGQPDPKTWAEIDKRMSTASPDSGLLAAELTGNGRCRTVHAVAAGKARPLGSMVKLYVLGTVADQIKRGKFGWDSQITIKDELKSLPSGVLQDRPDGTKVSVLEAAKLMISISDNTATDLLIHKVGRKAVERTMRAWGVADKRNSPLITTRDLFVFKGVDYPTHTKKYKSLSTAAKRAYLDKVLAKEPLSKVQMWTKPRDLDSVEFYASPNDICRAYGELVKLGDKRIGEAMSINDAALGLDRKQWPTVWFKGGSEPGVLDLSFMARTSEGKTYVVTTMAIDPNEPIKPAVQSEQLGVVRTAFGLARKG